MDVSTKHTFIVLLTIWLFLGKPTDVQAVSSVERIAVAGSLQGPLVRSVNRCNHTKDIVFANCYNLKEMGYCEKHKEKIKYYCPLTCKFCEGPVGRYLAPAPPQPKCKSSKFGCCKDDQTEALGKDYLGCPERCFDTPNYHCDFYKSSGFCIYGPYYSTMLQRCPLACGFCKKKTKKKCFNKWRPESCEKFKKFNLCTSIRFGKILAANCRKTCQRCIHNAPMLMSIARECSRKDNCCWDKSQRTINGRCQNCRDYYSKGFCETFKDDCKSTREIKGVQIRILCSKTCGLCDMNSCKDDIVYGEFCYHWKVRGECENNPNIMKTYCKKTCSFCHHKS